VFIFIAGGIGFMFHEMMVITSSFLSIVQPNDDKNKKSRNEAYQRKQQNKCVQARHSRSRSESGGAARGEAEAVSNDPAEASCNHR
jgi:hypothetical protein